MPLFDFYIMVDWSGGARRRGGRSDTIWIAQGSTSADAPVTNSPFSRTEAVRLIHTLLTQQIEAKRHVLVCFDFAYGYPVDFAAALQAATGKSDRDLPWLLVWQYLSEHIKDDEGTAPGAKPNNRSNRFEIANQINAFLSSDPKAAGPFWCPSSEAYRYIPQTRPPEPFQTAQGYAVKGLRLTDKRARSGSPFRLFGTASVGSQSLTGIARLHQSGLPKRNGFQNMFQSYTLRFIPASESLCPMRSRTEVKFVRCGGGRATWIVRIFSGVNFCDRSRSSRDLRRT